MKWYGLKFKNTENVDIVIGQAVGFDTLGTGDGEFGCDITYELDAYAGNVWLVKNRETAEWVCINSSPLYNAVYERPKNPYIGNLEVFEVEI